MQIDSNMTTLREQLAAELTSDEGNKLTVYKDQFGYDTIGVGRCVDARVAGCGLRPVEVAFMLSNDIEDRIGAMTRQFPWFDGLDDGRKLALLNMSFQLGLPRLLGFHNMLNACADGRWADAKAEALHSKWAEQTPGRALRVATQLETGVVT